MSLFGIGLPAVANIVSGIAGQIMGQNSAMKQVERQAELQRENWEYAQKNAHQFEVEDLKNAGLNPILSANHSQLASMPSVSSVNAQNPLNGLSDAIAMAQELKERKLQRMQDLAIKDAEQNLELKRINNEKARLSLDKWKAENEFYIGKEQLRYQGMSTASQIQLNNAQIDKWHNDVLQAWERLRPEIEEMKARKELTLKNVLLISHEIVKSVNQSNLLEAQKDDILRSWSSAVRKSEEMTAKQRYDYLNTIFGQLSHQVGFGLQLLNPFTAISSNVGDLRVGVRR